MEELLRKSCPNCTASSIKTYAQNVKGLAKVAGLKAVPTNAKWLTVGKLLEAIKSKPLNQYKRLAITGVKALGAYGKKDQKWHDAMNDATAKYAKKRDSQQRTDREERNWPKEGYRALKTLANTLHSEVEYVEKQAPARVGASDMYEYQRYFVILFYAYHALRGDLGDVRIERKGQNYIYKKGKSCTSASTRPSSKPVSDAIDIFLPMVRANTDHGYLLSTKRGRNKLSRKDMLILLRTTTQDRIGKRLGVQMIRVLKTTEHLKSIDEASELQRELGHGAEMQRRYVSKAP